MPDPKKNVAYVLYLALADSANPGSFKSSPTIAAGDFQVSTDGGAFGNLATLPVVTPAAGIAVKISLSASEMNGDNIVVEGIDAAGDEWDDILIDIGTTVVTVDDLVRSTTPANTLDVNAAGEAGLDLDNTSGTLGSGEIPNLDAAITTRATPAQVNIEVVDALNVDTITLPGQIAPPLAPTHREAISWLYKAFRNRKDQTSTLWQLYADDESTVDSKATVSEDGTTAVKQEIVGGP